VARGQAGTSKRARELKKRKKEEQAELSGASKTKRSEVVRRLEIWSQSARIKRLG